MHYKNHAKSENNKYCQENCNPARLATELRGLNSEICEQTFSWMKK